MAKYTIADVQNRLREIEKEVLAGYAAERQAPMAEAEPESPGFFRRAGDVATSFAAGVPRAAGALVQLAGYVPGLHYAADPAAAALSDIGGWVEETFSSDYQLAMQDELMNRLAEVAPTLPEDAPISAYVDAMMAQGGEAARFIGENPGQVVNLVAGSLPYLFGGGLFARGATAASKAVGAASRGQEAGRIASAAAQVPGVAPLASRIENLGAIGRGALGEGAIISGAASQEIVEDADDFASRYYGIPAGVLGAGITRLGAGLSRGADVDTAIARRLSGNQAVDVMADSVPEPSRLFTKPLGDRLGSQTLGTALRVGRAGTIEALEEAPQEAIQAMAVNLGTDRPLLEDIGGPAVLGAAAGFGMGAPMGLRRPPSLQQPAPEQAPGAPETPIAPTATLTPEQQRQAIIDAEMGVEPGAVRPGVFTPEQAAAQQAEFERREAARLRQLEIDRTEQAERQRTAVDMTRPVGIGEARWTSIAPKMVGTREEVEQTIRGEVDADGKPVFVTAKGTLNARGKSVLAAWDAAQAAKLKDAGLAKPKAVVAGVWNKLAGELAGVGNDSTAESFIRATPGLAGVAGDRVLEAWRTAQAQMAQVAPEVVAAPPTAPQTAATTEGLIDEEAVSEAAPEGPQAATAQVEPADEFEAKFEEEWNKREKESEGKLAAMVMPKGSQFVDAEPAPADPGVSLTTPAQKRALFFAMQGFVPEAATKEEQKNTQWQRASARVKALSEVKNGGAILGAIKQIHTLTREEDNNLKKISDPETLQATRTKLISANRKLAKALRKAFNTLETNLGRKNILSAMAVAKEAASVNMKGFLPQSLTPPQLAKNRETSAGILLNRAYRAYTEGRLEEQFITAEDWRYTTEVAGLGVEPVPRMQAIAMGASRKGATPAKIANPKYSPAKNLLDHIIATAPNSYTRVLAERISAVLEANGLLEQGQIVMDFKPQPTNKAGDGAVISFPKSKKTYAKITFYADGQNVVTTLHELVHAATAAAAANPAFKKSGAYKELVGVANVLLSQDVTQVQEQFGDETAAIIRRMQKIATDGKANEDVVAETLSYGLTNEGIQRLLMARTVPSAKAQERYTAMTGWRKFISAVKSIFKAYEIKNTQFERFMFASNEFMQEILTERGALQKPDVYKEYASIGAVPPAGDAPFDAEQMAQDAELKAEAERASKAKTESLEGVNALRDAQKKAKAAQERQKRAEEAKSAKERRAYQDKLDKEASTAVEQGKNPRDLTALDRLGRNVFNALLTPFMGRNSDWETAATNLWDKTGNIVVDWASKDTSKSTIVEQYLQRGVNRVFANVLDEFGTDKMFRGFKFSLTRGLRATMSEMTSAYETLKTLTRDQQYAILRYLATNDDAQLKGSLPDANDFESAKNFSEHLKDIFDTAKAYQLVEAKDLDKSLVDFISLSKRGEFTRNKTQAMGTLTASTSTKVTQPRISPDHILNKEGKQATNLGKNVQFRKVLEIGTGAVAYVQDGMTLDTLRSLELTYDPSEMNNLYTVDRIAKVDGAEDVELSRMKTKAEMDADGVLDTLVASLATSAHDWTRRIEGVRFNEAMLNYNNGLDKDQQWILDEAPEGVPENRLIDPRKEKERFGRVNANRLRIPGFWVKIPESEKQKWGDLAGKWVSAPVYSSILDAYETRPLVDIKLLRTANTLWKKNKTVWSPVTHMNNIGGNFALMYFHDLPMSNVKTGFRVVLNQMSPELARKIFKKNPITQQEIELGNEIAEMGIELVAHKYQELDQETVDTLAKAVDQFVSSSDNDSSVRSTMAAAVAFERIISAVVRTDKLLSELYSNQDNIFRAAAYITKLQDARARGEAVTQTLKEEAGAYARDAFVNYQINAPWINALRQGSIGIALPFLAWTYRMVPFMVKTALTKPWKLANLLGGVAALNAASYAILGAGADEEEERKNLPGYMQKNAFSIPGVPLSIRLPFGTGDKAVFFNIGNMMPLGNVLEFDENANLPGVLMPGGPVFIFYQAAMNHQSFRGKPITEDLDRFSGEHLADLSSFIWRELGPVALVNGLKYGNDVLVDKKGPLGSDPNRMIQAAKLLGINIVELDWPEQQYMKDLEIKRLQRSMRSAISRASSAYARQGRFADEADLNDEINDIVDKFEKRLKKLTKED